MKFVLVGDPHVTPDSLEECGRLMEFAYQLAEREQTQTVVVMGDLHHTHAVVRVEVTHFWATQIYKAAGMGLRLVFLVGNHDMPGNASGDPFVHALVSYKGFDHVLVVDKPTTLGDLALLPYRFDPTRFLQDVAALPPTILLCHQTFTGAHYENSFPAADGVDPGAVMQFKKVVAGHIHMRQTIAGKIEYVGSPRWLTASDANQERGIHVLDDTDGSLRFVSTAGVCRPIVSCVLTPDRPNGIESLVGTGDARLIITLRGPKAWATARLEAISKMELPSHPEIRSIYVEEKEPEVRESEGLAESLRKYVLARDWEAAREEVWNTISSRVTWLKTP